MTRDEAKALIDAFDVLDLLNNEEEMGLLEENNPLLADAYCALHRIAYGCRSKKVVNAEANNDK